MTDLTCIGKVGKTHGTKGELKFSVEEKFEDDLIDAKTVFIKVRGHVVPFFVEYARGGNFLIVKLEQVNSREEASLLVNKDLFLQESDISVHENVQEEDDLFDFSFAVGYTLFDHDGKQLGEIDEMINMGMQDLALVHYNNRDVLVPLDVDLVIRIDEKEKKIWVQMAEGLLDL